MYRTVQDFIEDWKHESASTLKVMTALTDDSLKQKVTTEGRSLGFLPWHIITTLNEMGSKAGLKVDFDAPQRIDVGPGILEDDPYLFRLYLATFPVRHLQEVLSTQEQRPSVIAPRGRPRQSCGRSSTCRSPTRPPARRSRRAQFAGRPAGLPASAHAPTAGKWSRPPDSRTSRCVLPRSRVDFDRSQRCSDFRVRKSSAQSAMKFSDTTRSTIATAGNTTPDADWKTPWLAFSSIPPNRFEEAERRDPGTRVPKGQEALREIQRGLADHYPANIGHHMNEEHPPRAVALQSTLLHVGLGPLHQAADLTKRPISGM